MSHQSADNHQGPRRVLAPLLLPPGLAEPLAAEASGPLFYLSWPAWEFFLVHRLLGATGQKQESTVQAVPLLLPDLRSPEEDFVALDQLIRAAGELGGNLLETVVRAPESLPGLVATLRHYGEGHGSARPLPGLDDRSYLALWSVSEYHNRRNAALLAEAAAKERAMWAALKGEEESAAAEVLQPPFPAPDDRRTLYAWQCWRRLAGPLLRPDDIVVASHEEL